MYNAQVGYHKLKLWSNKFWIFHEKYNLFITIYWIQHSKDAED